eukprot:TRINITY_DN1268_c0_g2_i3.p1 TRINITY_DN1268_c0_g2~~TRINITY_DN1268_c0_g2_i3.p1  ORF type:complete len:252 (+),score=46.07 TRINITY_DN1268_c0_g2_i3:244-999(+)
MDEDDEKMKLELIPDEPMEENPLIIHDRVHNKVFGYRGLRSVGNNFHTYKYLITFFCTLWIATQYGGLTYEFFHVIRKYLRGCCYFPVDPYDIKPLCIEARNEFHTSYVTYPKPYIILGFASMGAGLVLSTICLLWANPYIQWISLILVQVTFAVTNILIPSTQDVFDDKIGLGSIPNCGSKPSQKDQNWLNYFPYTEIPAVFMLVLEMWDYVIRNRKKIEKKIIEKWTIRPTFRVRAVPKTPKRGAYTEV